jgi:hypothetical protein
MKKIFLLVLMVLSVGLYAASEYDRDIIVSDQSRDEKVKKVFREMMDKYEDKDLDGFFSYVSEDRFLQDYMTFYEAIEKDMREYDTLSIDTWIDKITQDGVKRFLYVRWEKRYESIDTNEQIQKLGYSRFLFDEINGEYKLIELAGNYFWGESLPEWREEVPQIAGQELYPRSLNVSLPVDLTVENVNCTGDSMTDTITFDIVNLSSVATDNGSVEYRLITDGANSGHVETTGSYNGDIKGNTRVTVTDTSHFEDGYCSFDAIKVIVNPNETIEETNYNNNCASYGAATCP